MSGRWAAPRRPGLAAGVALPSPVRTCDYYLGGKDYLPVGREVAEQVLYMAPEGRELAVANRYFLVRAVMYLASQGIDQFINVGAGVIPARPDVHEVARLVSRSARVAYVDRDPEVVARSRALLAGVEGVVAVAGDVRRPAGIVADPGIWGLIDFSRPVGVLLVAVLHFVTDDDGPRAAVARLRDLMAPGSYLVLSYVTSDGSDPRLVAAIRDVYAGAAVPAVLRTAGQVRGFFDGFRLVASGVVDAPEWRPPPGYVREPALPLRVLAGVGRKSGEAGRA